MTAKKITKDLTTFDVLNDIQVNLKAPKNMYNNFGKYKYRNLEGILEGIKPLLKKHNASVVISDEIVCVNEMNYIKATVVLHYDGGSISSHAFARESVVKKGMDDSQITGTASSYARKYACNGLFAIDDTQDADSMDNSDSVKPLTKEQITKVGVILNECEDEEFVKKVTESIKNKKFNQDNFVEYLKVIKSKLS